MTQHFTNLTGKISDFASNAFVRALIILALAIPYRRRVPFLGWIASRLIAPLGGYNARVRNNLKFIFPDMGAAEVRKIMRATSDNMGRTLIEIYSGQDFIARVKNTPLIGEGADALAAAHAENRPVILVTGHFGNYDVPRTALIAQGYNVGALYNPMKNKYFNIHYERAINIIGKPLFARGHKGYAALLRYLKSGGMVGILVDQNMPRGAPITFFGKPASTALSAAELALRYDALLVPIYGIRQANGLDFEILVEPPIAHTDATQMTQALNDSLERLVRKHMGQWLWIHRRWKVRPTKA